MHFTSKMEHALREHARRQFATFLGPLTGPTVRNAERSIYNWSVQQTKQMNDEPSWDNRLFRWRYKHKLGWLWPLWYPRRWWEIFIEKMEI